jgi:transposase
LAIQHDPADVPTIPAVRDLAQSAYCVEKPAGLEYAYGMVRRGVAMMGQQTGGQEKLFYAFNLEQVVPAKHLLRGIDRCLDLSDLRQHLSDFYSHTGRPSIDPELMIRMLIVGYCYGIRSEGRLCEEVHLNLAYRWFCRLGLEDAVPNHSTFSKNRHGRFRESGTFRWLFDEVVRCCMAALARLNKKSGRQKSNTSESRH